MPELPEVETVKRGLAPVMEGARIVQATINRENLRFPFPENFANRLAGRTVTSVGRRAKYLLADLDNNEVLVMHLGMSGSFRIETAGEASSPGVFRHPRSTAQKHDHVILELETKSGTVWIVYNDPRRFGFMNLIARDGLDMHPLFRKIGIEPTGNAFDGEILAQLFQGKSAPLKAALLDQRLIAGLGNIYVCEALWRAGLSPKRKASTIATRNSKATERADRLARMIRDVISEAIDAGGSSLRDHRQTDGSLGYFQHTFNVYDRENKACRTGNCTGTVKRIAQSGRSTFYCPSCQR